MARDLQRLCECMGDGASDAPGAQESLAIDQVLALASDRLVGDFLSDLLPTLEDAMRHLVVALGGDRGTLSELVAGDFLNVLCSCASEHCAPLPHGRFQLALPWFLGQLRQGKAVVMATLPGDLSADAVAEAQHCRANGLRSHLSIPIRVGGRITSVVSFSSVRQARQWPPETLARLKVLGKLLGCVLALARTEQEADALRRCVRHADRVEHVSTLAAAIAHELNQPLASILGNAQAGLKYLECDGVNTRAIREVLQAVVREDQRAAETIRSMRAMMKKDEGSREAFDLDAALADVQRLLSSKLSAQGVRLEMGHLAPCRIIANRVQIEQLCVNLLLNAAAAVQCRPAAERVIHLGLSCDASGSAVLSVRDNGQGIAGQDLKSIFEAFWTTREQGLGLGLAICRSIVEAHGGRIWAKSNRESGATFCVELPNARHRQDSPCCCTEMAARASHRPLVDAADRQGALVSVVDDDPEVRASLLRLLRHHGWRPQAYASADEFLASRTEQDVACIVLDMHMPGTSGRELQQQLAHQNAAPSIIFITGHADVASSVAALKAGAEDFLEKPIDGEVLCAAVAKAVEHHDARRRQRVLHTTWQARVGLLSAREREIMAHVVKGRLNKQIAADLLIAEQTVKQHRGRVMQKMGVRSITDLVRICEATGFTTTLRGEPG